MGPFVVAEATIWLFGFYVLVTASAVVAVAWVLIYTVRRVIQDVRGRRSDESG